ncbi:MAG: hypothetical protein WC319_11485 [Candidatus Paceibacterota bacterium]|jgi:predicted secreted protein
MASISGVNGAVYYNAELTQSGTYTFSTGKTITSTGSFADDGFEEGMLIQVTGTTGNNRIFTITDISTGGDVITVSEAVTDESSTGTITEYDPGLEVCGFYNWTIDYNAELLEDTDFCTSSGGRHYIGGYTGWTATADKHFKTTNNRVEDWISSTGISQVKIRFFTKYVASPSSGDPAQYFEGSAYVSGLSQNTPVDALVDQSLTFQGDGALTLNTKTSAWNTTG